jgi:hypothetical protein
VSEASPYRPEDKELDEYIAPVEQSRCDWCRHGFLEEGLPRCRISNIARVEGTRYSDTPRILWAAWVECTITLTREAARRSKAPGHCPDYVPTNLTRLLRKIGRRKPEFV